MQPVTRFGVSRGFVQKGLLCLILAGVLFLAGQFLTQFTVTQPYSMRNQAISDLGITTCGTYTEYTTKQIVQLCSPLHLVMDATFVAYGVLIMLGVGLGLRFAWPNGRFRSAGLVLMFFGGIEAVVAGFSPLNLAPILHSISGGLAIAALNVALILLSIAAMKQHKQLAWTTRFFGIVGLIGFIMDGKPPYAGLGCGGWERVAGYTAVLWFMVVGIYLYRAATVASD